MASFVGMDPEAIRRVADGLQQNSLQLGIIQDAIQRLMNDGISSWEGADAVDFAQMWEGEHRASLQTAMSAMEKMALDLIEDIAEQEKASGVIPGGPGSALDPGMVVPGTTTPTGAVTPESLAEMSEEERAEILAAMDPKEAAKLLAQMDPEDAAAALNAMEPAQSAALLGAMTPAARLAAISAMSPDQRRDILKELPVETVNQVLDGMDTETRNETIGQDAKLAQIKSTLSVEAEAVGFKVEGMVEGAMTVNADGSAKVTLHGEVGAGKVFGDDETKGASFTGGVQGEREYTFASQEEAEQFIADLKDAATDISVDNPNPVDDILEVIDGVPHKDMIGGYIEGEGNMNLPGIGELSGGARLDVVATPDLQEVKASFTANVNMEAKVDDMASMSANGEIKVEASTKDGNLDSISLSMKTGGDFKLDAGGETTIGKPELQSTSGVTDNVNVGGAGELTIKVSPSDPVFDDVVAAVKSGDVAEATRLAYAGSEVTYRQMVTSSDTDGDSIGVGAFGVTVAEAGYEFTKSSEVSTQVYVKPPNSTHIYNVTGGA